MRYFLAVAEELHFGRAAQRLRIAQPAVSQQIRRLEAEIGVELFIRNRREVRLTAAGDALQQYARRAIEDVGAGIEAARRAARGEVGHLRVGFLEAAASTIVPLAVRRFRAERPDVSLTLHELSVDAQVEGLRAGRLDVGLLRPPVDTEQLVLERIVDEELVAAIPAGHELASRQRLSARTVTDQALVVLARETVPGLYDQILGLRVQQGGIGGIAQEASSIQAVLGLVAAGLGIAVLPASVRSLGRDGVVFVAIHSAERSRLLAVRRAADSSPLTKGFITAARAAASGE